MLLTEPPSPLQVRVNDTASLTVIDCEPDVVFEPDQSPEAVQLFASVDDQFKVMVSPRRGRDVLVLKLSVGSLAVGGTAFTVTVAESSALPPAPLQVML